MLNRFRCACTISLNLHKNVNSLARYTKSTLLCFFKHFKCLLAFRFFSFPRGTFFSIGQRILKAYTEDGSPLFLVNNLFTSTNLKKVRNNGTFKNPLWFVYFLLTLICSQFQSPLLLSSRLIF